MRTCFPSALVFNCLYNGLGIIRELGRRGVPVLALDSVRSVGTYSRYARYRRCPDPLTHEAAFVRALQQLGSKISHRAVLFPTNDHWAMAIARSKRELSKHFIPCVADADVLDLLLHKDRFAKWALQRQYPVPQTWTADQIHDLPQEAFPVVAKPKCRRISSNNTGNRLQAEHFDRLRLSVLKTASDLRDFATNHAHLAQHFVFQEYVAGLSDCMYTVGVYVDSHHKVRAMFTGRKVRGFPPDSGDCMVGEVRSVPERLKELVRRLSLDLRYQGIAEFEFKRDALSGEFKLIEVNPRSWSWVGITPACDVSLPWIAYADLTGVQSIEYSESGKQDGSIKWVRLFADLPNCLYGNKRAGFPEWHMTPRQWWKSLRAKRLVLAEWALDDPIPGCVPAWQLFTTLLKVASRKIRHTFQYLAGGAG